MRTNPFINLLKTSLTSLLKRFRHMWKGRNVGYVTAGTHIEILLQPRKCFVFGYISDTLLIICI
jgi:hypothetical protein